MNYNQTKELKEFKEIIELLIKILEILELIGNEESNYLGVKLFGDFHKKYSNDDKYSKYFENHTYNGGLTGKVLVFDTISIFSSWSIERIEVEYLDETNIDAAIGDNKLDGVDIVVGVKLCSIGREEHWSDLMHTVSYRSSYKRFKIFLNQLRDKIEELKLK